MKRFAIVFCFVVATVGLMSAGLRLHRPAKPLTILYPDYFGNRISIPADNPTTEEGVHLGRMLFYETALSASNKVSCATCHKQELAFTDGLRFSAGHDGMPQTRNTMSLANLLWVRSFFWDGRAKGLEAQAETPLTAAHEMGQAMDLSCGKLRDKKTYGPLFREAFGSDEITAERIAKALAQFERTLVSASSRYDDYLQGKYTPTPSEAAGMKLFYADPDPERGIRGAACGHCHSGPKTYNELFHNNGLDPVPKDLGREAITGQVYDRGRFRVPTLRNVALTAPYMHDGRFKTLEEVVDHYSDHLVPSAALSTVLQHRSNVRGGVSLHLTAQEKADVVRFLKMLTDSSFVTNKSFSNPF